MALFFSADMDIMVDTQKNKKIKNLVATPGKGKVLCFQGSFFEHIVMNLLKPIKNEQGNSWTTRSLGNISVSFPEVTSAARNSDRTKETAVMITSDRIYRMMCLTKRFPTPGGNLALKTTFNRLSPEKPFNFLMSESVKKRSQKKI